MTPENKIKRELLFRYKDWIEEEGLYAPDLKELQTDDAVSEAYDEFEELQDAKDDFRSGDYETDIESSDWSRHYEKKEVAAKMTDGTWVGWTYWYGGGKHGDPYSVEWMEFAYDIDCKEEEKMIVVRTFKKK